jgi:alkyldihydroxyacetonephosphate synthase
MIPLELGPSAAAKPTRLGREVAVDDALIARLGSVCSAVDTSDEARVEAGRDWWPLSAVWATTGTTPALPAIVVRPSSVGEVSSVLAACSQARVPVTPFAGRSGVCGGSVPAFGGVSLDLRRLSGLLDVDSGSLTVEVAAGTNGVELENNLRCDHALTLGHWPQSIALSTVGGWIACRGAGQYSTRYGKIEDIVAALEVVLADGTVLRTGNGAAASGVVPRAATGPDLTQLFVGSEGTLGVITSARLRTWPIPPAERRQAWLFESFDSGLEACRRIMRRGATPAVLRLYDPTESARNFEETGGALLVVLDEGDPGLVEAAMEVVASECAAGGASDRGEEPVGRWLEHRNQIPPLSSLVTSGVVAETVEVAGSWPELPLIYREAIAGLMGLEATIAASAHQSHSNPGGGCLYFTFAGRPAGGSAEDYYRSATDAITSATLARGGAISHHHGIGLNRARYMRSYLGGAFNMLVALKEALDPKGILNPGKLGLPSPFGPDPWP